ncbi:Uncharacterised protein [Mycobacterium tuberculosis]|nr:Uncharacterised protein [Mycobacterium tuberculosis]
MSRMRPTRCCCPAAPTGRTPSPTSCTTAPTTALPWSRLVAAPASLVGLTPFATTFAR